MLVMADNDVGGAVTVLRRILESADNAGWLEILGVAFCQRLAKSRDKKGLLRLALKGQEIDCPEDVFKDPLFFEFAGIPQSPRLIESELEEALISNLQESPA